MKTNYSELEKQIIKKNFNYKSIIDEYHQIENRYGKINILLDNCDKYQNDSIIVIYYKTLCKSFEECQKICDYCYLDDIISTVICKFTEDILSKSKSKISYNNIFAQIKRIINSYYNNDDIVHIYDCYNIEDEKSVDLVDYCYNDWLLETAKTILENSYYIVKSDIKRDINIFHDVFIKEYSLKDAGIKYGLSQERIRQIVSRCMLKIRKGFHILQIKDERYIHHYFPEKPSKDIKRKRKKVKDINKSETKCNKVNIENNKPRIIDGELLSDYIDTINNPHEVNGTYYITNNYHGNNNGIFESIILGRFFLANFSDNFTLLYNLYNNDRNLFNISMKPIFIEFGKFFNTKYYKNGEYDSLNTWNKIKIRSTIFHAFYSGLEFAIYSKSAYSGYLMYEDITCSYDLDKYFCSSEKYKYVLIDHFATCMQLYYDCIKDFSNRCNYNRESMLVEYLEKISFFDQYKPLISIETKNLFMGSKTYSGFPKYPKIKDIQLYSEMIHLLEYGGICYSDSEIPYRIRNSSKKQIIDTLKNNFIIDEAQAIQLFKL